jgi:hypothetical protein
MPVRAWIKTEEGNEFVKSLMQRKKEGLLILTESERERLTDIWLQNPGYHYYKDRPQTMMGLIVSGL